MSPFGYLPRYLEILGNLVTYSPNQILKQKFATRGHFLMVLAFPRERRSLRDAYPEERLPPGGPGGRIRPDDFGKKSPPWGTVQKFSQRSQQLLVEVRHGA